MTLRGRQLSLALAVVAVTLGAPPNSFAADESGSLIRVSTSASVAVKLDELPEALRDEAARRVLDNDTEFWLKRVHKQILHTRYVLTYRRHFYPGQGKRQLMLPPMSQWRVELLADARRVRVDGHDMVIRPYRFETMLLADPDSPAEAEPALAEVGGTWAEPFNLPHDPFWLFQRTGFACMDESENPPGSVFEENAETYFDHYCEGGGGDAWCHLTELPELSCVASLSEHTGNIEVVMEFERIAWDDKIADPVRITSEDRPDSAELAVETRSLENHWSVYRYFETDDCALVEQCVNAPGWRRLLLFDAEVVNRGRQSVHMGNPRDQQLTKHKVYEFSACHDHHHFRFYGNFFVSGSEKGNGHKQAFCLIDTDRRYNDESTSLVSPYDSCRFQGMSPGWGDSYDAGLDCQWVDVTDLGSKQAAWTGSLGFNFNPSDMLCEGVPQTDDTGQPRYEPTSLKSETGASVGRVACEFNPHHQQDNRGEIALEIAPGSFINTPCIGMEPSPKRDCGFEPQSLQLDCAAGQPVTLTCASESAPSIVRVCDHSSVLDVGIACTYRQSLATEVAGDEDVRLSAICPGPDSFGESGGKLSVFVSPLFEPGPARVNCEVGSG